MKRREEFNLDEALNYFDRRVAEFVWLWNPDPPDPGLQTDSTTDARGILGPARHEELYRFICS
jgi:hypothetical protein